MVTQSLLIAGSPSSSWTVVGGVSETTKWVDVAIEGNILFVVGAAFELCARLGALGRDGDGNFERAIHRRYASNIDFASLRGPILRRLTVN